MDCINKPNIPWWISKWKCSWHKSVPQGLWGINFTVKAVAGCKKFENPWCTVYTLKEKAFKVAIKKVKQNKNLFLNCLNVETLSRGRGIIGNLKKKFSYDVNTSFDFYPATLIKTLHKESLLLLRSWMFRLFPAMFGLVNEHQSME